MITKGTFMSNFIEGMSRIGDAIAAVISAQVTREAQERLSQKQ
jgi:hypothetical protein